MKTRFSIRLAYEGTDFCGWQVQRGVGKHANSKPSVEGEMIRAIHELCDEKTTVTSSGRTDAGVHASGLVAHFDLKNCQFPDENLMAGLNHRLPDSIRIFDLARVPSEFSAKKAIAKRYSYYFQQGPVDLPHLRSTTTWNRRPLDIGRMNEAVQTVVGTHDFQMFGSADLQLSSTVRTLTAAEVVRVEIPLPGFFDPGAHFLVCLRITGNGFLKQMVRRLAGTLKEIGEHRQPVGILAEILESRDSEMVGKTAPARGLWLDKVWYSPDWDLENLKGG